MRASLLLICLCAPVVCADVAPLGLLQFYDESVQHDASFDGARHAYRAASEEPEIGRAGLLPSLGISGRYGHGGPLDGGSRDAYEQSDDYQSNSAALNLSQPLYDKGRWATYERGLARGEQGEAQFAEARQQLFVRVVEAYFAVARASNELQLVEQQGRSVQGLLAQARRLYAGGEGTVTDVDEAQSRLDLIEADRVGLQARHLAALRTLAGRIGRPVETVAEVGERLPRDNLLGSAQSLEHWLRLGREASHELHARRAAVGAAQAEREIERAGHYPSLALSGQLAQSDNDQYQDDRRQSTYYLGVMLDIPLYQGGGVSASVRRAQAAMDGAEADYALALQDFAEGVESSYLGVTGGYQRCRALAVAVASNQRALAAAQKGYQAGVRSTVDILDAQQRLYQARRDLLAAKLDMLASYVELQVRSGGMSRELLRQVQAQL